MAFIAPPTGPQGVAVFFLFTCLITLACVSLSSIAVIIYNTVTSIAKKGRLVDTGIQ